MKHLINSFKSKLFYLLTMMVCFSLSVAHAQDLPEPWDNVDVGVVAAAGEATFQFDIFTVSGSGRDIWFTADGFHYAYQPTDGDCSISAYISEVGNTHGAAKACLMIRETLFPGSKNVFNVITIEYGNRVQYRRNTDGESGNIDGDLTAKHPIWLKLERVDNVFTGYAKKHADSVWVAMDTVIIEMNEQAYIGLAVGSHTDDGQLCVVKYENVELETGIDYPSAVNDIKTEGLSVYPNPVTDILTVDLGEYNLTANSTITIYNQLGQLLKEKKLTQIKQPVDLSDYSQGIYFIQYKNGQESIVQKIAKE